MSCCPTPPSINVGSSPSEDVNAQDTEQARGETVDCYMRRTGNDSGRLDDKTEEVPNRIKNTDIPLSSKAYVNVKFELTSNSTKKAVLWEMYEDDVEVTKLGNVTFTDNESTATLEGTFAAPYLGKQVNLKISAIDEEGEEIDQRGFVFSPAIATGSDSISFVHPLPGSHITSPYGNRKKPLANASSKHEGCDFGYGGKTADVLAAADGRVTLTGYSASGGNFVYIDHPNAGGKHLCSTRYYHLARIYVSKGQTVMAGQKIGYEGSTGHSTGPHLHFECRLPSGAATDPVPYIKGMLAVAGAVTPQNTAVPGTVTTGPAPGGVLTPVNVEAKENACPAFGPNYPGAESPVEAPGINDPFEQAWFFTLKYEVGPHWKTDSPQNPEIAAGLCETAEQKKNCGYRNHPKFAGGETKFGIAQGPNQGVSVRDLDYNGARTIGYNKYWLKGPAAYSEGGRQKLAVMLFDMNFLHGPGGANKIKDNANIKGLDDVAACEALSASQKRYIEGLVEDNPAREMYKKGWLTRATALLDYAKKLS